MKKSKQQTIPKEFPTDLVEEYGNICEKLKKHETALMKRFAPKIPDILNDFIGLGNRFVNFEVPEYAALCFQGAARCEKLQNNILLERHWHLKAADLFTKAYNRRLELGYPDGEDEFLQGALRCYNDLLTSPNLPQDSPLRAAIIRKLKKIDPHTDETSGFESPAHRYEDLSLGANVDIAEENYQAALSKLTDIVEDITERKVELFYQHVLERVEILRLLLLLYLNMPPATLAPCNIALLDMYTMKFDSRLVDRVKNTALDPELHLMFRAFFQSIQLRDLDSLRDSYDDIGLLQFLTPEQVILINLVFDKYQYEFKIEKGEECNCNPHDSSDDELLEEMAKEKDTSVSSKKKASISDPVRGTSKSTEVKTEDIKVDECIEVAELETSIQKKLDIGDNENTIN